MANRLYGTDEQAEDLLSSGRLLHALDVRLVHIAFSDNLGAAIRAIEMLRSSGAGDPDDELVGITTDVLLEARAMLVRRLRELEGADGSNGHN